MCILKHIQTAGDWKGACPGWMGTGTVPEGVPAQTQLEERQHDFQLAFDVLKRPRWSQTTLVCAFVLAHVFS